MKRSLLHFIVGNWYKPLPILTHAQIRKVSIIYISVIFSQYLYIFLSLLFTVLSKSAISVHNSQYKCGCVIHLYTMYCTHIIILQITLGDLHGCMRYMKYVYACM